MHPLRRVLRLALPGLVVVWAIAGVLVLSGIPAGVPSGMVWLGVGVGSTVGVVCVGIIEAAARFRPATPDGGRQVGMSLQVAAAATLFLKLLGVAGLLLWGFSTGLKFPVLMALGVAYAAAAVCIQVLGSLSLARTIAARPPAAGEPRQNTSGASSGS